jgi:hypothetical protein
MIVLVLVLLAVAVAGVLLRPERHGGDKPARIVAAAADRLPESRRDWGRAMVGELAAIPGRARRWQFAGGVLRVAVLPPVRHRSRVLAVAAAGLVVTVAADVITVEDVPDMAVFTGVLGALLAGYATLLAARSARWTPNAAYTVFVALSLLGVATTIAELVRIAVIHPAATTDPTHAYSIALAIILFGYLAIAISARRRLGTLWWVAVASMAGAAASTVAALTLPAGPLVPVLAVAAVAVLVATAGVGATTHDRAAARRAGLLTVALTAPMHVATDLLSMLRVHEFTLADPYDIASFAHSGFPDVASYVLSDAIGGEIISGLVLQPAILALVAILGAAAATARPRGADA